MCQKKALSVISQLGNAKTGGRSSAIVPGPPGIEESCSAAMARPIPTSSKQRESLGLGEPQGPGPLAPDIPDSQKVASRAQVVEKKSVSNVCSWRSPGAPFLAEELMLNLGHPPYIRLSNTQTLCPKKSPAEFRRSEAPGWRRPRRLSTASHPA